MDKDFFLFFSTFEERYYNLKASVFLFKLLCDVDFSELSSSEDEWFALLYDCEARIKNCMSEFDMLYSQLIEFRQKSK